jgi:hypothetical protein|tara:strand:+ start:74 stop:499 length:426 start_codon:yes stop_codon:yes gene_type:complete
MGKTYQTTAINAPLEKVWATIRNFHDMSWASNVIEECTAVGDKAGDEIGAQRLLNNAFHETLLELNDPDHTIRYRIDDGPSPVSKDEVSDYIGVLRLLPATDGDGTIVEWSSSWEGKDAEVEDFCHNIYVLLLADLKESFS